MTTGVSRSSCDDYAWKYRRSLARRTHNLLIFPLPKRRCSRYASLNVLSSKVFVGADVTITSYCDMDCFLATACYDTISHRPRIFTPEIYPLGLPRSRVESLPVWDTKTRTATTVKLHCCRRICHGTAEQRYYRDPVTRPRDLASTVSTDQTSKPTCSARLFNPKRRKCSYLLPRTSRGWRKRT